MFTEFINKTISRLSIITRQALLQAASEQENLPQQNKRLAKKNILNDKREEAGRQPVFNTPL
jgi:hypothetical protein